MLNLSEISLRFTIFFVDLELETTFWNFSVKSILKEFLEFLRSKQSVKGIESLEQNQIFKPQYL